MQSMETNSLRLVIVLTHICVIYVNVILTVFGSFVSCLVGPIKFHDKIFSSKQHFIKCNCSVSFKEIVNFVY